MNEKKTSGGNWERKALVSFCLFLFALCVLLNLTEKRSQHFIDLAQSFLHGNLFFMTNPRGTAIADMVLMNGRFYWPLGPFPAVLLLPFVAVASLFHLSFNQGSLALFLILLVFFLVYRLSLLLQYRQIDGLYFALACCGASAFCAIALSPVSYYFAHLIVVLVLFAALYEYQTERRWWLIGIYLACALGTRSTAGLGAVFFLLSATTWRQRWLVILPMIGMGLLLGIYNYARFGSVWEQGYQLQITLVSQLAQMRDIGLLSFAHVPANLYYFLLSTPLPIFKTTTSHILAFPFIQSNPWGMSLFVTSPYLLWLFFTHRFQRQDILLLLTSGLILLPLLFYYGIGFTQFGYRYGLDFFPFLFFVFIRQYRLSHPALTRGMKFTIILSLMFNVYLLVFSQYTEIYNTYSFQVIQNLGRE